MARSSSRTAAPATPAAPAAAAIPAGATHSATLDGETAYLTATTMSTVVEAMMARHPGKGVPTILPLDPAAVARIEASLTAVLGPKAAGDQPVTVKAAEPFPGRALPPDPEAKPASERRPAALATAAKPVSDFGAGNQIVDPEAKARIEATHEALRAGGVAVGTGDQPQGQLYATGTRMAQMGYDNQAGRKAEHDARMPLEEAAAKLRALVEGEKREDETMSALDFGKSIEVNGRITAGGRVLGERAIRGLLGRLESPALSYVLGLRDRIARESAQPEGKRDVGQIQIDKAKIADILYHECVSAPDVALKVRVRNGLAKPDIFAVVSPKYAPADAPELLSEILGDLPGDARGSFAYDRDSTSWELRANVWTPTPVAEQAVGEAFEGYVSFKSADNGTRKLEGGGGVILLACLNAGTYTAASSDVSRRHVGKILVDVEDMLAGSLKAINALCAAWGVARSKVIDKAAGLPEEWESLVGKPASQVIPGLWWGELTDRRSELAVLPGRTAKHVDGLTAAYFAERRDHDQIVRADFAQGWTRYIQDQPATVRRDAEAAIGRWLVADRPMAFAADKLDLGATA